MGYNMTYLDTSNNFMDIAVGVNNNTTGLLGGFVLLAMFIILLMLGKKFGWEGSFVASSFITSIIAILFYFIEFIGVEIMIIPIILCIVSLFVTIISK